MRPKLSFSLGILLCSTAFLTADKGDNPPAPAASEKPKTLPLAIARIDTLEADLAAANTRATAAEADRDKAVAQFNTATEAATTANTERDQARAELATEKGNVSRLTGELATANTSLGAANQNVSRLEALCGVKGIPANAAVPAEGGTDTNTADEAVYTKWASLTGAEKTEYYRANKAALDRYAKAAGDKEVPKAA